MISLLDCAALAADVYDTELDLASRHGWRRLDAQCWPDGFAAGIYDRDGDRVIAYRGTDDLTDALHDAQMVPIADPQRVQAVPAAVLSAYGLRDHWGAQVAGLLLGRLLSTDLASSVISQFANRTPTEQTQQAMDYFARTRPAPSFVVGHSLGGALAKVISQRFPVSAVGFNSPFMGDLQGVVPQSSSYILSVNTIGDPLSMATREVGNLPHGREIAIRIPPPPASPPQVPTLPTYVRPSCPRPSPSWYYSISQGDLVGGIASSMCEVVMDAWEPVGNALSLPQRSLTLRRQYREYAFALLEYLKTVAVHYHNMNNLLAAVERQGRFRNPLRPDFSSL